MCTTSVTGKERKNSKKKTIVYFITVSRQMLEFLLKTFKKKFTGVNRRHRRVNIQKKIDGWKL